MQTGNIERRESTDFKRIARLALFVSLSLTAVCSVVVAVTPRASGYEISVYAAFPAYFWYLLCAAIIVGLCVLVRGHIIANGQGFDRYQAMSIVAILIPTSVILLMPIIRGYPMYGRWDVLSHIGWTKDILVNHFISKDDLYPTEHILAATACMLSQMPTPTLTETFPQLFWMLFVMFFYVLARGLLLRRLELGVALALSLVPVFNVSNSQVISPVLLAPNAQSFFLMPLVIFSYFRSIGSGCRKRFAISLVILLLCIAFFHPLTVILLIVVFGVTQLSIARGRSTGRRGEPLVLNRSSTGILIALVVFFAWQSYSILLTRSLVSVYNSVLDRGLGSGLSLYSALVNTTHPSLSDLLDFVVRVYGSFILLGLLSLATVLFLVRARKVDSIRLTLSLSFLLLSILSLVVLSVSFPMPFGRVFAFVTFFSFLLIPNLFAEETRIAWLRNVKGTKLLRVASIYALVAILVLISIFGLYPSPRVRSANDQVTSAELSGMSSFFDVRDGNLRIVELGLSQLTFYDEIYGMSSSRKNLDYGSAVQPPDHFSYNVSSSFGKSYATPRYLLTSESGRSYYPLVYPEYEGNWRFSPSDIAKLRLDSSVNEFLDNGNLELYIVYPTASK